MCPDPVPVCAALLTAPGRGAIATIGVRGIGADAIVLTYFTPRRETAPDSLPHSQIRFGTWLDPRGSDDIDSRKCPDRVGEEIVVCRIDASTIEVHCHGGDAACRAILDDLRRAGARIVPWRTWLTEGEGGSAGELRVRLAEALTDRTAGILLAQCRGAWSRDVGAIVRHLDEGRNESARRALRRLGQLIPVGRHLVAPWRVAFVGPPNVGKSSLVNRLLGHARSIVAERPGTTRDVVASLTAFDGWPVELRDTAGIRSTEDPIENEGVRRARAALDDSDLVVLVRDAGGSELPFLPDARAIRLLHVRNKIDLPASHSVNVAPTGARFDVRVSAMTGEGIGELADRIVDRLGVIPPEPDEGVPVSLAQSLAVERALDAVESGDTRRGRSRPGSFD